MKLTQRDHDWVAIRHTKPDIAIMILDFKVGLIPSAVFPNYGAAGARLF